MKNRTKRKSLVRIYLDLETYRPIEKEAFIGENIILIGLLKDKPGFKYESFENFELEDKKRFKREKEILKQFYNYLKNLRENYNVEIIGFNILRFDIPLIISKSLRHNIVSDVFESELSEKRNILGNYVHEADFINNWWHNMYTIDIAQILLSFNKLYFKKLKLKDMAMKLKEKFNCEIKDLETQSLEGEMIAKLFENKRFDEIREKNKIDLEITRYVYLCLKKIFEKNCVTAVC
uniref:Predicted 3'-5' exonuclease PolB-like domain-containing protein n=1 Tax=Staphylothermus marinus TaxID=2280 RepID=A0A7C4DAR6_STAMA